MDYVKIPQNVRVEDKLIGPLSLRQIIMIALGGGTSYALFGMISKAYGSIPLVAHVFIWWPLILCAAFAVVRINDIPLTRYSLLAFELMIKPRRRVFQPRRGLSTVSRDGATSKKSKKIPEEKPVAAKKNALRIGDLSALLDQGSEGKDVPLQSATEILEGTIGAEAILNADEAAITEQEKRIDALWRSMKSGGRSPVSHS
ncbi:MAG TPA: PrgI family protein [Candidatus Peribacterales bacterium]|nr:PrgI family protein [Candidatus Peribacterales bacterium]